MEKVFTETDTGERNKLPKTRAAKDSEVAVRDTESALKQATADVVLGVPEQSDEELVQDFLTWLTEKAESANMDSMAALAQALRAAEGADNVREALKEPVTASSKDVCDRPFLAHGFTIHEGQYEDSDLPFFASIEAKFAEIDEVVILNTGAFKVLAALRALERIGQWPLPLVFVGKNTKKGRTVVALKYLGDEQS